LIELSNLDISGLGTIPETKQGGINDTIFSNKVNWNLLVKLSLLLGERVRTGSRQGLTAYSFTSTMDGSYETVYRDDVGKEYFKLL
jgi:hypothetical protein